ncbi:thioredoxin-dependent thiol peroxidase [Rhizobiaceae bacterium n13]|uniref:thioredoxin-dependent peroxiredoxin n=1 Tax=Ferirhizobium litorale TaxID=2927786 RepID=A0AAE3U1Y8_9HYPH|nr:thioredoxin-dependent thiol peroxidase [Fererhizobium litorale]MDI7863290.1 thioredoxin-dependent thiol peroxidase [Fererhizobium litorale]MDI7922976.1 thioredoxin-dependent thiol peroxidase [Fererhizobium litorale]
MAELRPGDKAPAFELPGNGGQKVSLSTYKGSPVVLFFYPKDDTSGCTIENRDFTALADEFKKAGIVVIGMSPDSPNSHDKFTRKHGLDVVLASDEEKTTLEAYGVWKEKSMYGRKYMGVERTTFLIDANGVVAKIWDKVKVAGHAEDVLKIAKEL